jgi:hypothetical protein
LGAVVAVAGLLLSWTPALALHRETPGAVRIAGDVRPGKTWGNYVTFASTENLIDPTPVGRQIYLYNHFQWVCQRGHPLPTGALPSCPNPPVPFLVRLTNGPGAPDHPSLSDLIDLGNGQFSQFVAYDADGSHLGAAGCSASRRQIFLKEIITGDIRQITFGCDGDSTNPTLSFHGGLLAFQSTASLTTEPTNPGVPQIYTYLKQQLVLRKITSGSGPSINPMINKLGTEVAFQSSADLLGTGADTGTFQIFWAVYDRKNQTSVIHQLTNGNASSVNPYRAEDAPLIAFQSSATNLPGAVNPVGTQVYIGRVDTLPSPDLPPVTQLTTEDSLGDCTWPTISPGNNRVGFICTNQSQPLIGSRVFSLDLTSGQLFLVSAANDVQGPIFHSVGLWFMVFTSGFDLTGEGSCGRHLFVGDFYSSPAPGGQFSSIIGDRKFAFLTGDLVGASQGTLTTRDGPTTGRMLEFGDVDMRFGAPDQFTGEVTVSIPNGDVQIPPIPINGVGAFCFQQTDAGTGLLDCDGGALGPDVATSRDHSTDDTDPLCLVGCREDDLTCNGLLPGPHRVVCPRCDPTLLRCASGPYVGGVCTTDSDCRVGLEFCQNDETDYAMCNGPLTTEFTNEFGVGGLRLTIPMEVKLSTQVGPDDKFCTDDDAYDPYFGARTVNPIMRFTSGVATGRVVDTDAVPGALLGTSDTGKAFDCARLRAGDLNGTRLVAALPFVDVHVPNQPVFFHDAIIQLRLEAKPGVIDACDLACTQDSDCNDLNACNGVETCVAGFCTAGTPIVCDDNNACNGVETCVPSTGECLSGTAPLCDDGNPCNGSETCDPTSGCVHGTPIDCNDGDPCNGIETCNPLNGQCVPGVSLCDDHDPCNGIETCDRLTATCHPGIPVQCDDHNPCNGVEACDSSTGACHLVSPPLCDDGNPCNGVETCFPATGACGAGTPLNCDDGNPCTADTCDPHIGCVHKPACDDGNPCNGVESCDAATGICSPGVAINCDDGDPCTVDSCDITHGCIHTSACGDGNVCNGIEVCDPGTGACSAGVPLDCNDNNDCTNDTCDPANGCVHTNNTNACDDGDLCTTGDVCKLGTCTGTPLICTDGNACNGLELCDPGTGTCLPGTPLECDDGNPCTDDSCDQVRGCIYTNNANPCDDGLICTINDQCTGGICTGAPLCDDGNACNGTETCDPVSGACGPGTPLVCDDGNPCTDDSCDPVHGCLTVNNTNACDDGSLCTTNDVCTEGVCTGTAVPCDDGNACNGKETCDPGTGTCLPGAVPNCDDGIACTIDACDPVQGCTHTPGATGIPGILCMLQALEAAVNSPPALAYRKANLQPALLTLVKNAETKMERALAGAKRTKPLLARTRKTLNRFVVRTRKAELKLFIERHYGDQLIALTQPPLGALAALKSAPLTASVFTGDDGSSPELDELRGTVARVQDTDEP